MKLHLEHCPFCGGSAELIEDFYGEGFMDAVSCTQCDACVMTVHEASSLEQLIRQWNTRAIS